MKSNMVTPVCLKSILTTENTEVSQRKQRNNYLIPILCCLCGYNEKRFPEDFMFQMSKEEMDNWKSQIVISNIEKMGNRLSADWDFG